MAKFQAGETAEGCILISHAYRAAQQRNDFSAQNFLQKFSDCWHKY
jgi:hypothetical protein